MNFEEIVKGELIEAKNVLDKILNEPAMLQQISNAAITLGEAVNQNKKIISCGNGGSHCDAMHFAEELTGRFRDDRNPIPAIAISDPSHITCVGNDYGFDHIFSRYVQGIGQKGDVLLGLTTSGNSPNILRAVEAAHAKEMKVIILAGKDGGKVKDMVDQCIIVPHNRFSDRIQEIHIKIIHILILLIEKIVR